MAGASFELYTADPEEGGGLFGKGILDRSGHFEGDYMLAVSQLVVYLRSTYIGLPGDVQIPVQGQLAQLDFNNVSVKKSGNIKAKSLNTVFADQSGNVYKYMGTHNALGVPAYLTVADQIDGSLLADVNNSLPEQSRVPLAHPEYLAVGNDVDIHLSQLCDVWVTFVHEGAGYKNGLGFYTYPTANPPLSPAGIDTTHIIFPNMSFSGSGGGLFSGDKVHLGTFPAGTSIGWVLLQDAYDPVYENLNPNKGKFYSNTLFNPEATVALRQHNVQLYHSQRDLVLIGFEDINRERNECDNDFNDAVFYVTSNPVEAIAQLNLPSISSSSNDADQDGVGDNVDDYPNDPSRAFNQYYPDAVNFSSLAFEDLWPATGDYDFNDLVVDLQYKYVTSSSNYISEIEIKLFVQHIGASFHNGFGIEFPFSPGDVLQASGGHISRGLVSKDAKGLETGQSQAVLIAFDDAFDNLHDTLVLHIVLAQPYSMSLFNQTGPNPFIFVAGNRGREVHLMNRKPTDLALPAFFNTDADASDPASLKYYLSPGKYPWAIEINKNYKCPKEKVRISEAYKYFNDWVRSEGTNYSDWYSKVTSEYRDFSKLQ